MESISTLATLEPQGIASAVGAVLGVGRWALLGVEGRPAAYVDIDPRKIGRSIHGVPVLSPESLAAPDRPFVLSYVSNHGAPELIAGRLGAMGYLRGRDYLVVG